MNINELLLPYNSWWSEPNKAFEQIPRFERPIIRSIYKDIRSIRQIVSITGPRRVGKSTLVKQIIKRLLSEGVPPDCLIYYSLDDPALLRSDIRREQFFEELMRSVQDRATSNPVYLFLDEIQRFEMWELFLKKYYDLEYKVRFIISGSASSPIFKKSRESLLGRVKDYHLLPFSFREYLLYRVRDDSQLTRIVEGIHSAGEAVMGMFSGHPNHLKRKKVDVPSVPESVREIVLKELSNYFCQGGFPEVWRLPDWEAKQTYLFDNQVQKVIFEDLVLAAEFRKPEALKRFYISLLERPGCEINLQQIAQEIGVSRANLEKYFPLLEMTDLLQHIERFRKSPLRVRRGNIKCYLVDLALRNAVLRLQEQVLTDTDTIGLYAENLVFNALKKWPGTVQLNYFRDRSGEVDFIVHVGAGRYLPVEVKYRDEIAEKELAPIRNFSHKFHTLQGLIVTKRWQDFGQREDLFFLPLAHFLLMFD